MRCAILVLTFWSGLALAPPVAAQSGGLIGIFDEMQASCMFTHAPDPCALVLPPFEPVMLYVLARPEVHLTLGGLTGVEFRVVAPEGLQLTAIPNSAAMIVFGSPVGSPGANLAWPACQEPDHNGVVLLYTVEAVNIGNVTNATLEIARRDPPTNLNFSCPLINACNPPVFTAHCADGMVAGVNRTTAVTPKPWTAVKALYR